MSPIELATAGFALLLTVALGTVVHELSHALALEAFDIPYEITWFPTENDGLRACGSIGALASVSPERTDRKLTPLGLRTAAMMPVVMVIPVVLTLVGVLPDPVAGGNTIGTAVVIGWLACALPSPQDFSILWYADRAVQTQRGSPSN